MKTQILILTLIAFITLTVSCNQKKTDIPKKNIKERIVGEWYNPFAKRGTVGTSPYRIYFYLDSTLALHQPGSSIVLGKITSVENDTIKTEFDFAGIVKETHKIYFSPNNDALFIDGVKFVRNKPKGLFDWFFSW